MDPASRMPRRLPYSMINTTAIVMGIVYGVSPRNADVRAAVPADVCTATVTV
jgi:hypothetical protein